jgi:hypothetical protein
MREVEGDLDVHAATEKADRAPLPNSGLRNRLTGWKTLRQKTSEVAAKYFTAQAAGSYRRKLPVGMWWTIARQQGDRSCTIT